MTLNTGDSTLYWLVRSYEDIRLYSAVMSATTTQQAQNSVIDLGEVAVKAAAGEFIWWSIWQKFLEGDKCKL